MRKFIVLVTISAIGPLLAQNLELINGKDFKQPGKINPAMAGIQEDLLRIISDTEIGQSYQFMVEGRLPLKLGNYMVGVEKVYTNYVANNLFNVTYNRKSESKNDFKFRYGGSLQFNQKSLLIPGFDSTALYQFEDINGEVYHVPRADDLNTAVKNFEMELGISMNYKNLLVGLSIENIIGQNISMSKLEARSIPLTANLTVGGFLGVENKVTFFPAAVVAATEDDFYAKASVDISTEKLNFTTAYIQENDFSDLSASVAIKYKKMFAGIRYTHPINASSLNVIPSFNLFLNTGIFKSREVFKSDFAKQMKKLY